MPVALASPEFLALVVLVAAGAAFIAYRVVRLGEARHLQRANVLLAICLLLCGAVNMERAQREELERLRSVLEGFAPTYAREMESLGHAGLALDAQADDPLYLRLIEAQKRWLGANAAVADIYTFRRRADGTVVLLVDSETDYDRDGDFDEEREGRTAIGEVYEEMDEALASAFAGQPSFTSEVIQDRWGAWVSANEPLRAPDGSVEAVLGVDYPAEAWLEAAREERLDMLGWMSALTLIAQVSLFVIAILLPHLRERRRVEAELVRALRDAEESSQAKSRFLATMSHELRTPLNGILGMGELLRDTGLDREQVELLDVVESSGRALKALIDDILAISGAEQGGLRLVAHAFDPAAVTRAACAAHAESARGKGLQFHLEFEPDLPAAVLGDGLRFGQLLGHLASNAVKFTTCGEVRVSLRTEPSGPEEVLLTLCVRDTGVGFDPRVSAEIFRPFLQLDSSHARRHGGAGLGLALVKEIARAMRGEVVCESQPGAGASFTFRVPLGRVDTIAPPEERAADAAHLGAALPAPSAQAVRSRTALVVDDQAFNRRLLERLLEGNGWSCATAEDGPSALELFRSRSFDAVLLDLAMPGMDGLEVLRHMRAHDSEGRRRTRILAVTALENTELRSSHRSLGFDGWVEKPVNSPTLFALLDGPDKVATRAA